MHLIYISACGTSVSQPVSPENNTAYGTSVKKIANDSLANSSSSMQVEESAGVQVHLHCLLL
jgi:hypothetical protein